MQAMIILLIFSVISVYLLDRYCFLELDYDQEDLDYEIEAIHAGVSTALLMIFEGGFIMIQVLIIAGGIFVYLRMRNLSKQRP